MPTTLTWNNDALLFFAQKLLHQKESSSIKLLVKQRREILCGLPRVPSITCCKKDVAAINILVKLLCLFTNYKKTELHCRFWEWWVRSRTVSQPFSTSEFFSSAHVWLAETWAPRWNLGSGVENVSKPIDVSENYCHTCKVQQINAG